MTNKVFFVGAGPGDPELITIKGRRLLDSADVIIYAGSLVNPALLTGTQAEIYDSAGMTLQEMTDLMAHGIREGKTVVRLHTGDTSFYSAISEQIEKLRENHIDYEVVPGVSSAAAAAAALKMELTIPEVNQTVIFTRLEGNTPVPSSQDLGAMSRHGAVMVIFLSISMIDKVVEKLKEGCPPETPVAVIERVSWPQERIIRGTIDDISEKVKTAGIKKTALILVGEALNASELSTGRQSKLYDKDFKHGYRK
ncbi:precorrin-4 C(11)-methyltransferase [Candidatus Magnetominusculus xianensis]|uniref:Cobalt-precorrin-4 C(11)-methyltransferase n=1 Tax=Candidatus Magnetominusculus xianensis TaxID=1748249 RepID=A0ABR5SLG0_9BACT|nr:precorrin-4 C(11)-methyltransferase [Candidatus Magnetominusculus xianensis]KWT94621.1 cobalt-precorrin-4 C(11)-methyltransferase [Candidatus Magnetominusculus xianensis]MBF0403333.1 precorrin-4 C(11)-methyltransferase [Nitrospirota bacterium]